MSNTQLVQDDTIKDAPARLAEETDVSAAEMVVSPADPARHAEPANHNEPRAHKARQLLTEFLMWAGAGAVVMAALSLLVYLGGPTAPLYAVAGFIAALFVTRLLRFLRPAAQMVTGDKTDIVEGRLAGTQTLSAIKIAENILDADSEARLITKKDGVVVFANAAYVALADQAAMLSAGGLPPRIDRLYNAHGAEATKIFRLCRAAKLGNAAKETVLQLMGVDNGGDRRRFEISVETVPGSDEFVSWRIAELPANEEESDSLASAYSSFVEPVFAMERSGQIVWANAAMRELVGAERGGPHHLDDLALGEAGPLIQNIWNSDGKIIETQIRRRQGPPIDVKFNAFCDGGVGEGYICVQMVFVPEEEEAASGSIDSAILADAPFGVAVVEGEIGRDAKIVEANKAFQSLFNAKKNMSLDKALSEQTVQALVAEIKRKANGGGVPRPVETQIDEGGATKHFAILARPSARKRGSYGVRRTQLFTLDISERKIMEDDFVQDQKLKSLGHVAGGVAHDFNNLLQVILGNCEHLMLRHPAGDPAYQELVLIRENAQRAANLTKQLLAFGRKQTLTNDIVSITDVLLDFSRFLDRAVGEKVKLNLVNGRGLPVVKVDRHHLENAVMNLAVNARDAMAPNGGQLTITTRLLQAGDVAELNIAGLDPVPHIEIECRDTGPGVPESVASKIFDPYFTTKPVGKGTGLGLSFVHGVIGQMGGVIIVDKDQSNGGCFRIFLPAASEAEIQAANASKTEEIKVAAEFSGPARILVVEDEGPVRQLVVTTLKRSGFEVEEVCDGIDALDLLEDGDADFDLVITDVMMPEVDGPSFIARAREEYGLGASVIFMSGYAESAMREQLDEITDFDYLQKPIPMATLGDKVKEVLAARAELAC